MSHRPSMLALTAMTALIFLCCLGLSHADKQVNLGSEDLPENTLELSSSQFQTDVEIIVDSSSNKPQMELGLSQSSDQIKSTKDIMKKKGKDKIDIRNDKDKSGKDDSSRGDQSRGDIKSSSWVLFVLCSLTVATGLFWRRSLDSKFLSLLVLLVALCVASMALTQVDSNEQKSKGNLIVYITIRIPNKWWWKRGLIVNLKDGNLKIFGKPSLEIDGLRADLCSSQSKRKGSRNIQIKGVTIQGEVELCADEVSLERVTEGRSTKRIDVTASQKAFVTFANSQGFFGSYSLSSPKTSIVNNFDCVIGTKSSILSGQCDSVDSNGPILRVSSLNRIYVDLNRRGATNTGGNTGVTTGGSTNTGGTTGGAAPSAPPSCIVPYNPPTFATSAIPNSWTIPGSTVAQSNKDYWVGRELGGSTNPNVIVLQQPASNQIEVNFGPVWTATCNFVLFNNNSRIDGGFQYQLSLSFDQSSLNTWADGNTTNDKSLIIHFAVFSKATSTNFWNWKWIYQDPSNVCCGLLYSERLHTGTVTTTLSLTSSVFSIPETRDAQIVFWVVTDAVNQKKPMLFNFKDINLVKSAKSRDFSSFVTKAAQTVDIPRPPPMTLPPPQTGCPHQETGLLDWHNPATWPSNTVPAANGDITLPDNAKVIIRPCSIPSGVGYSTIYIPPTSELIFDEADINMVVGTIKVDGKLRIGSPTCRLRSYITITFDTNLAKDIGTCGKKGICVNHIGSIDIHGYLYHPTWVRLASTGQIGDDRIYLQEAVNWEVGQEIVIITSSWVGDLENERRIISAIDTSGRIIQFTPPLAYTHYGGVEYQTEVALLSRRIVLQGDAASESSFEGGHVFSMSKETRISGVHAYRMGKKNIIGRYPLHFHMAGSAPDSYFSDNAVVHSFYRCYTVHGTHNVTLKNNVAFDATGHCYYIEDGVEEDNHFLFNFAGYINYIPEFPGVVPTFSGQPGSTVEQNPNLLIPADVAAGGFYITNANNEFIGNAAVGGFAGFSFVNLPDGIGLHRNASIVPMNRPLKYFYGNTVHSSNWQFDQAGCIYIGGQLYYPNASNIHVYISGRVQRDTRDLTGKDPAWMLFQHTQTWQCSLGLSHWGQRIELIDYEAHDVERGSQIFGQSWQGRSLINARSGNPTTNRPDPVRGFQFYDTFSFAIVTNTTYSNFEEDDLAWIDMTHSDFFKPQGIAGARGIEYVNVYPGNEVAHRQKPTGSSRYWNIMDWDGSVSMSPFGAGNPVLIGGTDTEDVTFITDSYTVKDWWRLNGSCKNRSDWQTWLCPKTTGLEIGYITIIIDGIVGWWDGTEWEEQKPSVYLGLMSQFGHTGSNRRSTIVTNNPGVGGVTGNTGWYFTLTNNVNYLAPQRMIIYSTRIPLIAPNDYTHIYFAIGYPKTVSINVTVTHRWTTAYNLQLTPATSELDFASNTLGQKYFLKPDPSVTTQNWLYLKMIQRRTRELEPERYYFARDGVIDYKTSDEYWYTIETDPGITPTITWGTENFYEVSDSVPDFFPYP